MKVTGGGESAPSPQVRTRGETLADCCLCVCASEFPANGAITIQVFLARGGWRGSRGEKGEGQI